MRREREATPTVKASWDELKKFSKGPVSFQSLFVLITGSVNAALLLSQMCFWKSRTKDPEGWFYKTQAGWFKETGLSSREQESARQRLKKLGLIKERFNGKLHFRVNGDAVQAAIGRVAAGKKPLKVAFYRIFVLITGSVKAALFLSQACYKSSRTEDGSFCESHAQWKKVTGLSKFELDLVRKTLRERGLITERFTKGARIEFKVSFKALQVAVERALTEEAEADSKLHRRYARRVAQTGWVKQSETAVKNTPAEEAEVGANSPGGSAQTRRVGRRKLAGWVGANSPGYLYKNHKTSEKTTSETTKHSRSQARGSVKTSRGR